MNTAPFTAIALLALLVMSISPSSAGPLDLACQAYRLMEDSSHGVGVQPHTSQGGDRGVSIYTPSTGTHNGSQETAAYACALLGMLLACHKDTRTCLPEHEHFWDGEPAYDGTASIYVVDAAGPPYTDVPYAGIMTADDFVVAYGP